MSNNQSSEEPTFRVSEFLSAVREPVFLVGSDMRIKAFNEQVSEAFAASGRDIQDRRLSEVIRDFSLHEAFKNALRKEKSSEVRIEILNEKPRVFDVLVSPLNLHSEPSAIGVFYERTIVEKLERVRQEFLSNISHELRTPLTSILAFIETLEDGAIEDPENNRRFLEVIRKNAKRMHLLVDDISELSSIESGNIAIEKQAVLCHQIAEDVLTSLSASAAPKELELINEIPEDTVINADVGRLHQMLTNLVDNAIKFNRRCGSIIIKYEALEKGDVLSVSDTGEGILKEHQQRIFERFYRVDRARTLDIGGTGLGLAIVKHLAILHGGEVSVSSVAGKGTTFRILFPVQHGESAG